MSLKYDLEALRACPFEEIQRLKKDVEQVFQEMLDQKKSEHLSLIQDLMDEAMISPEELAQRLGLSLVPVDPTQPTTARRRSAKQTAQKYRDPVTGKTWSGRGNPPKWMKDHIAQGHPKADLEMLPQDT